MKEDRQAKTNIIRYHLYTESTRNSTERETDVENSLTVMGGNVAGRQCSRGGINWEIGTDILILPYIKYRTNQDLLYIAQGTLLNTL